MAWVLRACHRIRASRGPFAAERLPVMRAAILPAQGQAICVTVIVLALIAAATARKAAAVRSSAQMQRTVISGWLRLSSAATGARCRT